MKKLFILFAVILFVSGCTNTVVPAQDVPVPTPTPVVSAPVVLPSTQIYNNGTYNFEFTYPVEFVFANPVYTNFENQIVQINLPKSAYPSTNFGDAAFAVGSVYTKTLPECLKVGSDKFSETFDAKNSVVINGATFYKASASDAGMGNLYESRGFLTYHDSNCFEIVEMLHSTRIENYPENTVKEIDKALIWQRLDDILNTFKFISNP
ncbi:MAG: hypothetical protein US89_C0002G0039 [Candidatus Peregrinibacteria bacterium GW2011_GWF2_38_29]|nr:MAG: hypothetical protein US89_C0002G0039 [Candidatus Peregrinibacteria bacterium GW2011_GWF2_38_29]HBB02195.1 hypothetical protein [Candidatus Peregrinibacteria bacterium]